MPTEESDTVKSDVAPQSPDRRPAYLMLVLFSAVSAAIVLLQAFAFGYGLNLRMSISQYVGLKIWSSVLFLISNLIITFIFIKYVRSIRKELQLTALWCAFSIVAMAGLVILSICPIGLFDEVPGQFGVVSTIHRISSSTMFVMLIVTSMGLAAQVKNPLFRSLAIFYVIYGTIAAALYIGGSTWFQEYELIIESTFIVFYLILLCIIPKHPILAKPI